MDEVQDSVSPEIAPQHDVIQTAVAQEQSVTTKAESSQLEVKQERNWKAMRKRQEELENELRLQREMNERLLQMSPKSVPAQEIDELDKIADDEFIPKGKVTELVQKRATKIAEDISRKEAERFRKEHEQSQFLDRLKRQYSDFDEIVNPETLSLLETEEPELAQTIASVQDPYKIGIQSYKYIKALGLSAKAPETRRVKEVDKKLEQNEKTVQSPQAFDKRPMAQAFKMTDVEKTKLYEEMMGYASQSGYSY